MASTLSRTTSDRLKAALAGWKSWNIALSGQPSVVRGLGGKSNENYLVTSGKTALVVRINNRQPALGVDRSSERSVLLVIRGKPWSPSVVHADDDYLVSEFIAGEHPGLRTADTVALIGRLFRDIHRCLPDPGPLEALARLDPLRHLDRYFRLGQGNADTGLTQCYAVIRATIGDVTHPPCLCHNDLLLENVILSGPHPVAIDWEYAGVGDPAFDLGVFAETYHLGEGQLDRLLTAYGDADPTLRARLTRYRLLYALLEVLWWRIRAPSRIGTTSGATLVSRFGL